MRFLCNSLQAASPRRLRAIHSGAQAQGRRPAQDYDREQYDKPCDLEGEIWTE